MIILLPQKTHKHFGDKYGMFKRCLMLNPWMRDADNKLAMTIGQFRPLTSFLSHLAKDNVERPASL